MSFLNRRDIIRGAGTVFALSSLGVKADGRPALVQRTTDTFPRCTQLADGTWTGFEIECSREVCALAGVDFIPSPVHFSWPRSLRMMEAGNLQLLTSVSYRKERERFMDYIGIYDVEEIVVIVHKDNADVAFEKLDDFTVEGRIFEHVPTAVFSTGFDERIANDPEFAAHFTTTITPGSGDRRELVHAQATRVFHKRIFGAVTDWYSYCTITTMDRDEIEGRYNPDDLVAIRANVFGTPPTWLAASREVQPDVLIAMKESYQMVRASGTFSELWHKWYGPPGTTRRRLSGPGRDYLSSIITSRLPT